MRKLCCVHPFCAVYCAAMGAREESHVGWILLSDSSDRFVSEFRSGVLSYAKEVGVRRIHLADEQALLEILRAAAPGEELNIGYIGAVRDAEVMSALEARKIPCILIGEDVADAWHARFRTPVTSCATDHGAIGRMAAGYLQSQGRYRSYVYIDAASKPRWHSWSDQRYAGFARDLRQRGVVSAVPRLYVMSGNPEVDRSGLVAVLADLPHPVGAFCCNDRVAHEASLFCHGSGLCIPDDVAFLGVDDARDICDHAVVALSSIQVDRPEVGGRALRLMEAMLQGTPARDETLRCMPLRVVERASTQCVGGDLFVMRAMQVMGREPDVRLPIERIVAESGASRSYLERRFKESTGMTLHGYQEEMIMREVQHQLATTNFPVTTIAAAMGYESPAYLCTKFRRRFGMTMQTYRQKNKRPR